MHSLIHEALATEILDDRLRAARRRDTAADERSREQLAADRPLDRAGRPEAGLADAADGRPSLAFVAAESGVHKSRLLAELERRARAGGALVLAGDCVDLELPYVPFVAALRRWPARTIRR